MSLIDGEQLVITNTGKREYLREKMYLHIKMTSPTDAFSRVYSCVTKKGL